MYNYVVIATLLLSEPSTRGRVNSALRERGVSPHPPFAPVTGQAAFFFVASSLSAACRVQTSNCRIIFRYPQNLFFKPLKTLTPSVSFLGCDPMELDGQNAFRQFRTPLFSQ